MYTAEFSTQVIAKGDLLYKSIPAQKSKDKMTNLEYYHFIKTNKIRDVKMAVTDSC